MDGQWIDELARTLGRDVSRRGVLQGIALGLAGVAWRQAPGASAQDPCDDVACDPGSSCVNGECVMECQEPFSCPPAFQCVDGVCVQYCARPDEPCDDGLACCDSFMCAEGVCVPVPCVPAGQPCPYAASAKRFYVPPCCDGLVCGPDSTCVAPCVGETNACATDADCCDWLVCRNSVCAPVAPALGEIVVDGYDCGTGILSFHVSVVDLPYLPNSNGSIGYSIVAHYQQGDLGSLVSGFNPDPESAPYTGDLYLTAGAAPFGEDASFPVPEPASGPLESIDIVAYLVAVSGAGPIDTRRTNYPVNCGGPIPVDPAPAPPASDVSDPGGGGEFGEVLVLPNTGAGSTGDSAAVRPRAEFLGGLAALCGLAALRLRRRTGALLR